MLYIVWNNKFCVTKCVFVLGLETGLIVKKTTMFCSSLAHQKCIKRFSRQCIFDGFYNNKKTINALSGGGRKFVLNESFSKMNQKDFCPSKSSKENDIEKIDNPRTTKHTVQL